MHIRIYVIALLSFASSLRPSQGSVISDVNFDRHLRIREIILGGSVFATSPEFLGSGIIPGLLHETLTAASASGSLMTAEYNFSDYNTSAAFQVDMTYLGINDDLGQELGRGGNEVPITFTTTVPVTFTLSGHIQASGGDTTSVAIAAEMFFLGGVVDGQVYFGAGSSAFASLPTVSGTLPANTQVTLVLLEEVGVPPGTSGFVSGASTFSLSLTPINVPEPSTAAFGLLGFLGLALRRTRNARNA